MSSTSVSTTQCQYCARSFAGKEQSVRGIIKNHERYCIRNPNNSPTTSGFSGSQQQPSSLEELQRKLSMGDSSSLILYECGGCMKRFSSLPGLKEHVTTCVSSPVRKPAVKATPPSTEVTKTIKFSEEEAVSGRKAHSEAMIKKTRQEKKKLEQTLEQRRSEAEESAQGKRKSGASKFQCTFCEENFLGKHSLESHHKICEKKKKSEKKSECNVQPFIAKIQQPEAEGSEPQDMIGLFIPIGMLPNSPESGPGLPDMAAVTEMMQKQQQGAAGEEARSDQGAPAESVQQVMKLLPRSVKCEDCNRTFPPDASVADIEKHDCGAQTPQKLTVGTGDKTQTVVIDEVQCKYCLRTVNQKMDLIKHYRFCLGLKGSQKTAAESSEKDDSAYSLFSDEMRDEPLTPRRSARKRAAAAAAESAATDADKPSSEKPDAKRRRGRVYGKQEEDGEEDDEEEERADEAETGPHSEDELESETRDELDAPPEAPPEDAPAMVRRKSTRSKPPKGIVVEPKEEKTKWKTIYVVPPVCPYCKMQFKAFSSLKMHYRYCYYRKNVAAEGSVPSMPVLPRERDGVQYMWPEEAAKLFYTKCNFCQKRFASERTRISHMHKCPKRRAKPDEGNEGGMSLADLEPSDKVRCTGCGSVTERASFSEHLRGCRKRTPIHRPGAAAAAGGATVLVDEHIREGQDFFKETEDDDKEGFLEKFGLSKDSSPLSKEKEPAKEERGVRTRSRQKQQVEEVEEAPQETSTKSSAEGRRKDGGGDAQVGVDESATETTITLQLEAVGEASAGAPAEAPGETREEPAAPEPPKPARRLAQSVKVIQPSEEIPDPKKALDYHCPDCGVLVKSHDGLRSHKLFCDQINKSTVAMGGEEKVEGSNFKVPSKLMTDIMPDCIYHCGYCGGILKEGPQFKEHVMSCYEDICRQNVTENRDVFLDQNHETLLKEIRSYPEFNERDEKIPQLMVLTSKQILDKADQAKAKPQPFLMFECSVCTKILNTQTMAAKHSNACQKTATKRERQEQKREQRREQDLYRIENEKRKSIEQNMAKKCEEMGYIYECFDCGRRFVSKVNVSRHMPHCVGVRGINPNRRDRDNSVPGNITCKFCQRGFLNVGAMRSHLRYCYYRDLETREAEAEPKAKIIVDSSGQVTQYVMESDQFQIMPAHQELEGAVAVQAQQGEGDEQQEGEITFMVQVQPDEEEEAAAQPQPGEGGEGEEIIVQAVDLDGNAVSAEVLAQLQQAHKVVGMGAYQYGESEQPTRVVMGTEVSLTCPRCDKSFTNAGGFVTHQKFCKEGVEEQQVVAEAGVAPADLEGGAALERISKCLDCGMLIQTEQGLLNHQKFCQQFKEAAKNVPAQPSKKVIVRTTAPGAQLSPTYEEPVSPRRSPRTSAHAQPTVTLAAPSAGVGAPVMMEEPPQGEEAQVLVRKVVKRKVFNL